MRATHALLALAVVVGAWQWHRAPARHAAEAWAPSAHASAAPVAMRTGKGCATMVLGGLTPTMPALSDRESFLLCEPDYLALTSGLTRTGLWSAEHLTAAGVVASAAIVRTDSFHAEESLPHEYRAELSDYRGSGFDRGHLAPNSDALFPESTFTLAQMIPQAPVNNRHLWAWLEHDVRAMARRDGDLYVVTGALFEGGRLRVLAGRVYVPTHVWKALYDPRTGVGGVYVASNDDSGAYERLSLAAFTARSGIDPFPALRDRGPTNADLPPITSW